MINCTHASNSKGKTVECAIRALGIRVSEYGCLVVCTKREPIPGVVDEPYRKPEYPEASTRPHEALPIAPEVAQNRLAVIQPICAGCHGFVNFDGDHVRCIEHGCCGGAGELSMVRARCKFGYWDKAIELIRNASAIR